MRRWVRAVLPPEGAIGLFACLYLLGEGAYWLSGREPDIMILRDFVLISAAIGYGIYRVAAFHPLYQREYREWLRLAPWSLGKPLPVGSIHLVPQDGVMVLILYLLAQHEPFFPPIYLPIVFLTAYLLQLGLTFWPLGQWPYAYAMAFGIGLIVRLWAEWQGALGVAIALYPIALAGLSQSLARFPWDLPWYAEQNWLKNSYKENVQAFMESHREHLLGWPYNRMPPDPQPRGVGYRDGILMSLLAGWWMHAGVVLFEIGGPGGNWKDLLAVGMISVLACGLAACLRLVIYYWAHQSPIGFWGRVFTFRWIIPGYDQAVIGPLLTVLAPVITVSFLAWRHDFLSPYTCVLPLVFGLLMAFTTGPSLRRWELTGKFRLVPGITKQNFLPTLTKDFGEELLEI